MSKITIHTNLFAVKVDSFYITEDGKFTKDIKKADYMTQEEAEDVKAEFKRNMPKWVISIESVTEEMAEGDFIQAVCDEFNNHKNTWDWEHSGQYGRYAQMAEIFDLGRLHSIQPDDVKPFIKSFIYETPMPVTISQACIWLADQVGQHVLVNPYDDVTFIFHVK